ncbi:MAG: HD-GYP domain-containing protein [Actinomycetota bacterium]
MVWNAFRRRTAAARVEHQTHMLGFDLEGRYAGHERVPLEQQLAIAREISHALETKSAYTRHHSRRVERHARRMAAAMGLSRHDTEQLAIAAELHDIGNIQVPEHLLSKPGILTELEREAIEGHVALGAAMAFTAGSTEVVEGIRHHHERWDGTGYPKGLVGDEIPLFARMIAVAEAFDALTSPRPYRCGFTREHATQVLEDQAGTQFDPNVVDVFVGTLHEQSGVAFVPLLALPIMLARDFFASVRRMGNASVAALVGGGTALVLLGTAIVAPGTLELPSEFTPPQVTGGVASPITVHVGDPDRERDAPAEQEEATPPTTSDRVADVVLGTRFHNDPPIPVAPDPTPTDEPSPHPPIVTPPEPAPPVPGIGGPTPDPDIPLPDGVRGNGKGGGNNNKPKKGKGPKDKNPDANGNGHAYGHAYGHDHAPGQAGTGDHPGRGNVVPPPASVGDPDEEGDE